jgi:hypothetical protein
LFLIQINTQTSWKKTNTSWISNHQITVSILQFKLSLITEKKITIKLNLI